FLTPRHPAQQESCVPRNRAPPSGEHSEYPRLGRQALELAVPPAGLAFQAAQEISEQGMARKREVYETKVPEVTLGFWVIKILATTLGETGGDSVTMTWLKADVMVNAGYLVGSAIFLSVLIVLVIIQISARRFHPFLYWSVIVASTTAGTAMADFATRSLGVGYTGGSLLLFACLMAVLGLWYLSGGSFLVGAGCTPKVEAFYLAGITLFQNPGTPLRPLNART